MGHRNNSIEIWNKKKSIYWKRNYLNFVLAWIIKRAANANQKYKQTQQRRVGHVLNLTNLETKDDYV
jgi:hypothetical protein